MNIDHIQFQLRRRRLDEIYDFAITVLRHHPDLFTRFAALPILVFLCANVALIAYFRTTFNELDEFDGFWQGVAMIGVLMVEQSALRLPLILANGRLLFQSTVSVRDVWTDLRSVAVAYVWRSVILRNLLLFVLWPRYFFLSEVVALERGQGPKIRARLENLSRRQNDRILGFRIIAFGLGLIFLLVGMFVWSSLRELGIPEDAWVFSDDFSLFAPVLHLLFLIFSVYHATARFLFYIDTRSLLEGWDVEKMLLKGVRDSAGASR